MTTADEVLARYIASLADAGKLFTAALNADFLRHIDIALAAMAHKRPMIRHATLALVAGQCYYETDLPADIHSVHMVEWPSADTMNLFAGYCFAPPRLMYSRQLLTVSPAPTSALINCYPTLKYRYLASHVLGADPMLNTLADSDIPLLILRAQAEAMRELAMRAHQKPVTLRGGSHGSGTSNMQPSALYELFLAEFQRTQ